MKFKKTHVNEEIMNYNRKLHKVTKRFKDSVSLSNNQ